MERRTRIGWAFVLIALGAWFFAIQISSEVRDLALGPQTWPLPIIGAGLLLALVGLVSWTPTMLIPASVIAGMGLLLYRQNATGNWSSWAYAWSLIPAFMGFGILLTGLLTRAWITALGGLWLVAISVVFYVLLSAFLGEPSGANRYWPFFLILLGALLALGGVLYGQDSE